MMDQNDRQSTPGNGRRVIIISTDRHYGKLLKYGLEMKSYDVCLVEDKEDAVDLVRENKPDAIVLDVYIAVADCMRLLHWIQEESKMDIPTLVLTSSTNRTFRVEMLVAGARDVLYKPATFPAIVKRLEMLWNGSSVMRNKERAGS